MLVFELPDTWEESGEPGAAHRCVQTSNCLIDSESDSLNGRSIWIFVSCTCHSAALRFR